MEPTGISSNDGLEDEPEEDAVLDHCSKESINGDAMEEEFAQKQPLIDDLESASPADAAKPSSPSLSSEEPIAAFPSTNPPDEDPFAPLDYDDSAPPQVHTSQPSLPENDPPVLEVESASVQVSAQVSGSSQEQEATQVDSQVEDAQRDSSAPLIPQGDAQDDESSHKRSLESSFETMKRVRTAASSGPDKVELRAKSDA